MKSLTVSKGIPKMITFLQPRKLLIALQSTCLSHLKDCLCLFSFYVNFKFVEWLWFSIFTGFERSICVSRTFWITKLMWLSDKWDCLCPRKSELLQYQLCIIVFLLLVPENVIYAIICFACACACKHQFLTVCSSLAMQACWFVMDMICPCTQNTQVG